MLLLHSFDTEDEDIEILLDTLSKIRAHGKQGIRNPETEAEPEPEYFSYKFFLVKKCATLNTVFNMPCCRIFLPVISIDDSGRLNLMFMIDIRNFKREPLETYPFAFIWHYDMNTCISFHNANCILLKNAIFQFNAIVQFNARGLPQSTLDSCSEKLGPKERFSHKGLFTFRKTTFRLDRFSCHDVASMK